MKEHLSHDIRLLTLQVSDGFKSELQTKDARIQDATNQLSDMHDRLNSASLQADHFHYMFSDLQVTNISVSLPS